MKKSKANKILEEHDEKNDTKNESSSLKSTEVRQKHRVYEFHVCVRESEHVVYVQRL